MGRIKVWNNGKVTNKRQGISGNFLSSFETKKNFTQGLI